VGMGKELNDSFPGAKAIFEEAARVLGAKYVEACFAGPEETLKDTRFTQPALFIVSAAAFAVLKEWGISFAFTAGHSLGEYSALYAAGVFDFATGLNLVKERGEAIFEASQKVPGTMAALIGPERAQVQEFCKNAGAHGVVEPVNYNCPGQTVIAGSVAGVQEAVKLAQAAGFNKSIQLNVSGPFHSSLMKPAAERMASVLQKAAMSAAQVPVIANCDARLTTSPEDVRKKLVTQIDHAVLWEDSLKELIKSGVEQFIEVGAGRVLGGLLRRTDKTKKYLNIEDAKSASALKEVVPV
jgi:[acyl-carrier-protein] S-malonyltransferase